jgi:hypothetical protein
MSNLFREGDRWAPSDGINTNEISDGYHTFGELYDHRLALTSVLAADMAFKGQRVWRSKAHHPEDGPIFEGYFIIGMELSTGTITYHYSLECWDYFPAVPELEHGPKWDGAVPADTVVRLLEHARSLA